MKAELMIHILNDEQNRKDIHSFTCGNDSNHQVLVATLIDGKIVWVCKGCDYKQPFKAKVFNK